MTDVISSLIAADRARIDLPYKTACAIDLAGRDVLEAVHTSVNPKVIDCPDSTAARPTIDAVAKDGVQLKARARVTVRTNIERLPSRPAPGTRYASSFPWTSTPRSTRFFGEIRQLIRQDAACPV